MKKSLKKILIVALVATSGVAAVGGEASAANRPAAKTGTVQVVKLSGDSSSGYSVQAASGIRW